MGNCACCFTCYAVGAMAFPLALLGFGSNLTALDNTTPLQTCVGTDGYPMCAANYKDLECFVINGVTEVTTCEGTTVIDYPAFTLPFSLAAFIPTLSLPDDFVLRCGEGCDCKIRRPYFTTIFDFLLGGPSGDSYSVCPFFETVASVNDDSGSGSGSGSKKVEAKYKIEGFKWCDNDGDDDTPAEKNLIQFSTDKNLANKVHTLEGKNKAKETKKCGKGKGSKSGRRRDAEVPRKGSEWTFGRNGRSPYETAGSGSRSRNDRASLRRTNELVDAYEAEELFCGDPFFSEDYVNFSLPVHLDPDRMEILASEEILTKADVFKLQMEAADTNKDGVIDCSELSAAISLHPLLSSILSRPECNVAISVNNAGRLSQGTRKLESEPPIWVEILGGIFSELNITMEMLFDPNTWRTILSELGPSVCENATVVLPTNNP